MKQSFVDFTYNIFMNHPSRYLVGVLLVIYLLLLIFFAYKVIIGRFSFLNACLYASFGVGYNLIVAITIDSSMKLKKYYSDGAQRMMIIAVILMSIVLVVALISFIINSLNLKVSYVSIKDNKVDVLDSPIRRYISSIAAFVGTFLMLVIFPRFLTIQLPDFLRPVFGIIMLIAIFTVPLLSYYSAVKILKVILNINSIKNKIVANRNKSEVIN